MKPLVIFEGPDGTGKTTLAREVARSLGAMYVHHGAYPDARPDQLARAYHIAMLPALDDVVPVVFDRSWLSEPIYGEVFRGGYDRVQPPWRRMLDRVRLTLPSLVVKMSLPFEAAWATVSARPSVELAKRRDQLERVVAGYDRLRVEGATLELSRFDNRGQPVSVYELATRVASALPERELPTIGRCDRLVRLGVVGHLCASEATALLVGDRRSDVRMGARLPFINYDFGGCSAWLAEYLESAGVSEASLTWVNAYGRDYEATALEEVVELARPRVIVALGAIAHTALLARGVAVHAEVPHPRHVKRFHHHDASKEYALASIIKEALS